MTVSQSEQHTTARTEPAGTAEIELEVLARQLASVQKQVSRSHGIKLPLLESPDQQEAVLRRAQQHYASIAEQELTVSYAGEWLLDNFYIVQQSLYQITEDIPRRFYAELPKLDEAPLRGFPRVYAAARQLADWFVTPLTLEQIKGFLHTYQQITPLTMGELWALPAILRVVNLEDLIWSVGQLIGIDEAREVLRGDNQPVQPADETRIANAIINLRMLATQDWKAYFEDVSRVEQVLRQDPAGVYPHMDFATRNRYRQMIELLAPDTSHDEERIAQAAVQLARQAAAYNHNPDSRTSHVGYYLLETAGLQQLKAEIGYQPTWQDRLTQWRTTHPTALYLGGVALLTVLLLVIAAAFTTAVGGTALHIVVALLLTLLPASAIAVESMNWLISRLVPPTILPKMDYSEGIPADYRTLVVVPALLSDRDEIDSLQQQLELHFLRNTDPHLDFALLLDFMDAPQQHMPEDEDLLAYAQRSIETLNEQYGTSERRPFHLFLRERRWNPSENMWMGWERKRGKLEELNRLLLDPTAETSFIVSDGSGDMLPHIRYVITLDADTILPKDSARRLVGTMAHPLNQAQFDAANRVVCGYTVLQPRTEINPATASQTLFTRIFSGDTGFDLYTLAVSDVYQDWFDEGIYIGKGIYDVAAFNRSVASRTPENAILSHDLFEGLHGRAALVTDVILLEDYPPHYLVHTRRLHRWIRGDWQLLPWLMPRVPLADGRTAPNPFSVLDRWKILDNLRRSLLPPALLLLLLAGWLVLPGGALVWTLLALGASAMPLIIGTLNTLRDLIPKESRKSIAPRLQVNGLRWLLSLVFLPHESYLALHGIAVTLYRLIRRQHLLQWTTAARTVRLFGSTAAYSAVLEQMIGSPIFAVIVALGVALVNPAALWVSLPLLALWGLSPAVAHWLGRPVTRPAAELTPDEQVVLRSLARRTWLFFEQFIGPEDHWLPPDHFQEWPRGIVAHYTSPTNIGLMLLSTLAAYDLGYIGLLELSARLQLSFESMEKLERYRGHFLNWYDTRTLAPLHPRYVSTVDSGNLACCLLALRQGLHDLSATPIMRPQRWQGLQDTLIVLEEALAQFREAQTTPDVEKLIVQLANIRLKINTVQHDPVARVQYLAQLSGSTWPEVIRLLVEMLESASESGSVDVSLLTTLRTYVERVSHHVQNIERDTHMLLPWLALLAEPPALFSGAASAGVQEAWQKLLEVFPSLPHIGEVFNVYQSGQQHLRQLQEQLAQADPATPEIHQARAWCQQFQEKLAEASTAVETMLADFKKLEQQIDGFIQPMDFRFLFNDYRKIFHIGYNVTSERLDNSYYDLLASEARLASLFTIAMEQVPQEHWLHLGRPLTRIDNLQTLLSWSGTMFEYMMPTLLMRNHPQTLLNESYAAVIKAHMRYGQQRNVPWGISESGYYAFDANQNYQYRAFGVPGVAFKRGLAADLVIAPYASVIALPFDTQAVLNNVQALQQVGMLGMYGFYEAVDYTPTRLALGQERAIVREFMSHHQGMIFLALLNALSDNLMVRRFHDEPRIQSVELLLQEQLPQSVEFQYPSAEDTPQPTPGHLPIDTASWTVPPNTPVPQVHYLSNGRYGVLLTGTGGGYSQWQTTALTRWRADTTLEDWGMWLYLRDQDSGHLWSIGDQPTDTVADYENVVFFPHKAEFQRRSDDISVQMEVTVPPEDDLEIRRIRLTNHSDTPRRLLLTSYAEVVLAPQGADQRHPAFNKLFIESRYLPSVSGLLFRRRPRSAHESPIYMLHMLVHESSGMAAPVYETDREQFLGRSRTPAAPEALTRSDGLTGTTGATLDPIMALGQEIELEPHASVQVAYVTLAAESRGQATALARSYQVWSTLERAFNQVRYRSELEMRRLSIESPDIQLFQKMLSALLYPQPELGAPAEIRAANTRGQPGLWAYGISGDYPIVLVKIQDETELALVRALVQAHTYWRHRQIKVTLVILNQRDTGYTQELYNQVHHLIVRMGSEIWINRHDGIFLLRADLLSEDDLALLAASARVYLDGHSGTLAQQLEVVNHRPVYLPHFTASLAPELSDATPPLNRPDDLHFDNGFGGFASDGREYIIYWQKHQLTPAPWINVIANPEFGFTVSETGGGFSWAVNSSENRLSAWRNDPVTDMPSEAVYLRDEETADIWSPTPLPATTDQPYLIRHGWGYTIFEHHSHGLKQQTRLYTAPDAPVKIVRLRLENTSDRVRRITVTHYTEWVLGTVKDITQQYIIPDFDSASQTLLFRNPYSMEFGEQFAFITANKPFHGLTTDRTEFLGRLGSYARPAALERIGLSGAVRAGTDPCSAVQLHVDLQPGAAEEVTFLIGAGPNREAALEVARQYSDPAQVETAWEAVTTFWRDTLTTVTAQTPDPGMNLILPWLLYQALSCRIWGRSALYQSGGAFGFRDQLQDVMSLVHTHPVLIREHILRAARHQFEAGDVLHWWHPPSGRGVRTRFSDDLLWLPFVVAYYVSATGDEAILQEKVPFLKGAPLRPEEEERYGFYESTTETHSLYEHCRRALEQGLTAGAHGLPLMGSGDWNDGMNRVGIEGRGESIWLGWFLCATLTGFIDLCERMEETAQAQNYQRRLAELKAALEEHAWDGQWYLRAFYDDGTPLGSSQSMECQIDAIAQSWGVISDAADPARRQQAMQSVLAHLVKREDQLLLLFTPPFDKTDHDPGYIKGYPPGIRENGGQYTHAAIWTVWALAKMGQGAQAGELFQLLNPIHHSDSPEKAQEYRVEPYVIAADVYSVPPHTGRGGWTWYTGSSGWMYRLGIEAILGLRREGDWLKVEPCIPETWPGYAITYRFGQTTYHIRVENPNQVCGGIRQMTLDDAPLDDFRIPLADDGQQHQVVIILG